MSHRIDVIISDKTNQGNTIINESGTPQVAAQRQVPTTETGATNNTNAKITTIATLVATQTFNYMTSNIGKWTGSQARQNDVNKLMTGIGLGVALYANPYLALATAAIKIGTTAFDNYYENKWDKRESNQARAKAGELKGRRH